MLQPEILEGLRTAPAREANGRLAPGHSGVPGAGRTKLPDFFKAVGPDALRAIADIATGEIEAPPELQLRAAQDVADRIYGRAKAQDPEEQEQKNDVVAAILLLVQQRAQ